MVKPHNDYYTYVYLRADRTPYYIGKGRGKRIYSKARGIKAPKNESLILFLKKNLTEAEAFKHEIYMIFVLGRKDLGTGILRNLTEGGDGPSGAVRNNETRKKLSAAKSGEKTHNLGGLVKTPRITVFVAPKPRKKQTLKECLAKKTRTTVRLVR